MSKWVWQVLNAARSYRGVLKTTLWDQVCQWLAGVSCFLLVLGLLPPIKLTSTI